MSTWIDTQYTEYPRLVNEVAAQVFTPDIYPFCMCEHGKDLTDRCVVCEGLSILEGTRR